MTTKEKVIASLPAAPEGYQWNAHGAVGWIWLNRGEVVTPDGGLHPDAYTNGSYCVAQFAVDDRDGHLYYALAPKSSSREGGMYGADKFYEHQRRVPDDIITPEFLARMIIYHRIFDGETTPDLANQGESNG